MLHNNVLKNICYVLKKSWVNDKAILLILLIQTVTGIAIPFISVYLPTMTLKAITERTEFDKMLINIIILILLITICNCISAYCEAVYDTYLMNNKIKYLTDLYRKNMELDYEFVESKEGKNQFQYVMSTLLDDNKSVSGMLHHVSMLWSNLGGILLYVGIISRLELWLLIILMVTSIVHFWFEGKLLKSQHEHREEWVDIDRKLNYVNNYVKEESSNKDIKIFFMRAWLSKIADILIQQRLNWVKRLAQFELWAAISDVVMLIIRDGLAYFCILSGLFSHKLVISQFTFYFGIITGLSIFITGLTNEIAYISQKSREIEVYRNYMEKESRSGQEGKNKQVKKQIGIKFQNVFFRFAAEGEDIIKNLNLEIQPGESVALVGENGAGKTTLVKLLCGLYHTTKGKILLNGIEIEDWSQEQLENYFAIAFQDVHILPMTVGENIAFGEIEQKKELADNCLKLSGLDRKLNSLDMPLTKILDPKGAVLSGGEEQRLVLARTIFKVLNQNSPILILDEPTAALDPLAEKMFYEKYQQLASGRISIFISHRLASTRFCDRILVMREGEIIESGTHQQLMNQNGYYRELFDLQSQYYKEV